MKKKSYLSFDDLRVAYDARNDIINITSGDPVLKKQEFKLTVRKGSPVERGLRKLLDQEGLLNKVSPESDYLQNYVAYPAKDNKLWNLFPLGVTYQNQQIAWDCHKEAHLLIEGQAGSGKTVSIRNLIHHVKSHTDRWEIVLISPNAHEYQTVSKQSPLKDVFSIHTTPLSSINALNQVHDTITQRYTALYEGHRISSPKHILVVVDNLNGLLSAENDQNFLPIYNRLVEILRLGRAAGVHLVVSTQTNHYSYFTEIRDFFPKIIQSGKSHGHKDLSPEVDVPAERIPAGRALVFDADKGQIETQLYFTDEADFR